MLAFYLAHLILHAPSKINAARNRGCISKSITRESQPTAAPFPKLLLHSPKTKAKIRHCCKQWLPNLKPAYAKMRQKLSVTNKI